jgi:hypothetical protein
MEVRLRRSIGGGGALSSDEAEAGACWLDDGGEEGSGSRRAGPGAAEENDERRRRASQASALLAHQNLLMSPGAADRVFGYRSGSGSGMEEGQGQEEAGEQTQARSSPSLSAADILRGPMRFGASVVEQRGLGGRSRATIPSSPPHGYGYREGEEADASVSGSASKRWPKEQYQQYQQYQQQRRRSSLSDSAHRIVCGLRLAKGDVGSIALLLVLYTLQGIPMGLSASVPFLLQDRVSYKQQALFSLVSLPFSFKLVWAPIVDSTRFLGLGRRKVRGAGREGGTDGSKQANLMPRHSLCIQFMISLHFVRPSRPGSCPCSACAGS